MRQITFIFFVVFIVSSCRKEIVNYNQNFIYKVRLSLKDSLLPHDYEQLDFSRALQSKVDSIRMNVLRIPFRGKKLANDFVLVEVSDEGLVKRGKIIHLIGAVNPYDAGKDHIKGWNGDVQISSLDRKTNLASPIIGGYITALHSQDNSRTSLVAPSNVMPEVVITYTLPSAGGEVSWSSWISIHSFFLDYGDNVWSNYYLPNDGGGTPSSGTGGAINSGSGSTGFTDPNETINEEQPIFIGYDEQAENAAVEIDKYLACFDAIPNDGATAFIEILTDIPVDSDPNKLMELGSMTTGHTFVNIVKQNGLQRVSQNIGWYPKLRLKPTLTPAPVEGKFVDNGGHEFNAAFKMNLSVENLEKVLMKVRYLARFIQYDIDEYNCTDFALELFNVGRTDRLQIPLYHLPGSITPAGSATPNGLYNKLLQMLAERHPEANNITGNIVKGYAARSKGPCQ